MDSKKTIDEVTGRKPWDQLKSGYFKREMESKTFIAQDQPFSKNSVSKKGIQRICVCYVCYVYLETGTDVAECPKLAPKVYTQVTHNNVTKMIHWKLCEKWGFQKAEKWYMHKPEKSLNKMTAGYYVTFLYRQTSVWNIPGQRVLSLMPVNLPTVPI